MIRHRKMSPFYAEHGGKQGGHPDGGEREGAHLATQRNASINLKPQIKSRLHQIQGAKDSCSTTVAQPEGRRPWPRARPAPRGLAPFHALCPHGSHTGSAGICCRVRECESV